MKNLIDTKKSLVTALSRYGRVLSLLIVALTLSNAAWSKLYIYGGISQDNPQNFVKLGETDGTSFKWDRSSELEKFVASKYYRCIFTKTDSKTQSDLQSNGIYVNEISGVTYFNYCQRADWGQIYFVNFQPNTTLSSVTITISEDPSTKKCNIFNEDKYCANYNVVGTPYVCTATAPTLTTGTLTYSHPTVTVTDNNLVSLGQNADCSSVNCFQRGVELTTDKSSSSIPRLPASGVTTGTFSLSQDYALSENVTYYYRAFATTNNTTASAATGYGEWKEFTYGSSHDETTATVRVGAKPTVTPSTGAIIHAYLALQGCHGGASATISKITAYYSTSEPTIKSAHVDLTGDSYTQGNSYNITIPAASLDALGAGVTVRVKLSATNDNTSGTQESALSDEIRFTWAGCTPPANPTITGGTSKSVCSGNTITLESNTESTKWYIGDTYKATGDTYTTDALTSATTVVAKAFSSETCLSSGTSITISINNVPAQPGEISGISTLCANQTYTNQFSITALSPAPDSYTWSVVSGNLTVNGNGTQCSVTTAADFSGGQIQVVATNGCGNSTPRTLDLTKTGEPVIELSATPATSVCSGNDVTISVTAQNVTTHTWSTTSGWTQKSSSISQAVYTTAGTTAQTITYTGTNVCGVSNSANIVITPKEIPSLTIAAPADACGAGEITFTSSNVTEGATVKWYEGSTHLADGPSYTYNDVAAGFSKTVKAKATLDGCESGFTATVTGTRKVTPSITITLESSAITAGEAGKTYIWEEAVFTPNPTGGDVTYKAISQPTGTGKYIQVTDGNILKVKGQTAGDVFRATYVATGSNGCAANATKDVTIMKYEESCSK